MRDIDKPSEAKNRRKWFMEAVGHTGLNNLLAAYTDKSAEAVCTFAFSEGPGFEPIIFQGRTSVSFSDIFQLYWFHSDRHSGDNSAGSGSSEFWWVVLQRSMNLLTIVGWDPIFQYEGQT